MVKLRPLVAKQVCSSRRNVCRFASRVRHKNASRAALDALDALAAGTDRHFYAYATKLFFDRVEIAQRATNTTLLCAPPTGRP